MKRACVRPSSARSDARSDRAHTALAPPRGERARAEPSRGIKREGFGTRCPRLVRSRGELAFLLAGRLSTALFRTGPRESEREVYVIGDCVKRDRDSQRRLCQALLRFVWRWANRRRASGKILTTRDCNASGRRITIAEIRDTKILFVDAAEIAISLVPVISGLEQFC